TIIIGNLESAERALQSGAEGAEARLKRSIDNAMIGAQRAATLTQRLLAFSRRQPLDPRPVDLNRLLSNLSGLLRPTIGEAIDVEVTGPGDLWLVEADEGQLESALVNLALNARDAMPNGGELTIEASNSFLDEDYARKNSEAIPGQYVQIS